MISETRPQTTASPARSAVVTLQGPLDSETASQARRRLRAAFGATAGAELVVDVQAVTEVDSAGLAVLAGAAEFARHAGGVMRLRHPSATLVRRLARAGWEGLFVLEQVGAADLAVARRSPGRAAYREEAFIFPARMELVSEVRSRIAGFASAAGLAGADLDDVRLAVGEALTNALRHGCRFDAVLYIGVRCATDGGRLRVEVRDPGPGFDPKAIPAPDTQRLQPGGLGIHFMRTTMDRVEFHFPPGLTIVKLEKSLPGA